MLWYVYMLTTKWGSPSKKKLFQKITLLNYSRNNVITIVPCHEYVMTWFVTQVIQIIILANLIYEWMKDEHVTN